MRNRAVSLLAALGLAIVAVFGIAPAASATGSPPGASYVAFGDSEAAGTGNLLYVDRGCLRSRISYPLLLGATSYACASATTADTVAQVGAAVQAGKFGPATKLVTVTAGVNDLAWQDVLLVCYSQGDAACAAAVAAAAAKLGDVGVATGMIVGAVRQAAPNAKILVTGYPHLFGHITTACTIGWYAGQKVVVSGTLAALANGAVDGLNTALANAVAVVGDPKAAYVDLVGTFDRHGLCDTGLPWINGIIPIPALADGSLHINGAGQLAISGVVWRSR